MALWDLGVAKIKIGWSWDVAPEFNEDGEADFR